MRFRVAVFPCSLFVLCFTAAGWSKMIATDIVVTPASSVGLY